MCRIASYLGPSIPLENIVTAPEHSLLTQSREAIESKVRLNGDGFGIAWYGHLTTPGLYRDCLPAWSDENLTSLCQMMQSHLFLAHVRASTVGETMRANCHPFVRDRWCLAHNGQIGGFPLVQRELTEQLSDELYLARRGTTDSEILFLMLLQQGLDQCPLKACRNVIKILETMRHAYSITEPLRLTFVFSEGERLFGVRYASDQYCPTLYHSKRLDNGGTSLASEPLDADVDNWVMLPPSTFVEIGEHGVHIQKLME